MSELIQHGLACKSCPSSDAMAEYDDGYYCFSCQATFSKKRGKVTQRTTKGEIELPADFSYDLPDVATDYLNSVNIPEEIYLAARFGWSNSTEVSSRIPGKMNNFGKRLILPYFESGKLLFYEAKSLEKHNNIKYVTVGSKKDLYRTSLCKNDTTIIVEDIISAVRLGEFLPTIALRGTSLSTEKLIKLKTFSNRYIIWLDGDIPGVQASRSIVQKLRWFAPVQNIKTERDPKWYSNTEIKQILEEAEACLPL